MKPDLHQRVGAAVDADEDGLHLVDVAPQVGEVTAVVGAPHDDEGLAAAEVDTEVGERRRVDHEVVLVAHVLERVLGEPLEFFTEAALGRLVLGLQRGQALPRSLGDQLAAEPDLLAVDAHDLALVHAVEHFAADAVDQRDAGGGQQQRPDVRVPARDRRAALITAAGRARTRFSAAMRSRSSWSMIAISPGWSRSSNRLVRRSHARARPAGRRSGPVRRRHRPARASDRLPVAQQLVSVVAAGRAVGKSRQHPGELDHPPAVVERRGAWRRCGRRSPPWRWPRDGPRRRRPAGGA